MQDHPPSQQKEEYVFRFAEMPDTALRPMMGHLDYRSLFNLAIGSKKLLELFSKILVERAFERMVYICEPKGFRSPKYGSYTLSSGIGSIESWGSQKDLSLRFTDRSGIGYKADFSTELALFGSKIDLVRLSSTLGLMVANKQLFAVQYNQIQDSVHLIKPWIRDLAVLSREPGMISQLNIGFTPDDMVFVSFEDPYNDFFVPYQNGQKLSDLYACGYLSVSKTYRRFKVEIQTSSFQVSDCLVVCMQSSRRSVLKAICYNLKQHVVQSFLLTSLSVALESATCQFNVVGAVEDRGEHYLKAKDVYDTYISMSSPLKAEALSSLPPEYRKYHAELAESSKESLKKVFSPIVDI